MVVFLLDAPTSNLRELARIAGGDPKTFYLGVNVDDLDLTGQDLRGMEFSSPLPEDIDGTEQLDLNFPKNRDLAPSQIARRIKGAGRQEERAVLLLAEVLQNRLHGLQILESYPHDKGMRTNEVIQVLKETLTREPFDKRPTDLQLARKVSGRFAKSEYMRPTLNYFMAKHLNMYPEIRKWLRGKSMSSRHISVEKLNEALKLLAE
jgi:hypothetical protein